MRIVTNISANVWGMFSRQHEFDGLKVIVALALVVTLAHGVSFLALEEKPTNGVLTAWGVIATYQVIVIVSAWIVISLFSSKRQRGGATHSSLSIGNKIMMVLAFLTTIGLAFHYYGKWPLLVKADINCLGSLRDTFLHYPREQLSFNERLASMVGHLLSNFYAPALLAASVNVVVRGWGRANFFWFLFFLLTVVAYAVPMVSRSVLLSALWSVALSTTAVAFAVRNVQSWRRMVGCVLISLSVILALSAAVFGSKVGCVVDDRALVKNLLSDFEIGAVEESLVIRECSVCALMLIYVNHGIWNLADVASMKERGDPVLFAFAKYWARRLGLFDIDDGKNVKRVYGPGGMTLPGAAYHDYGWLGVISVAVVIGSMLGLAMLLMSVVSTWFLGIVLFVLFGLIEGESLLFVGPATLSFPFVMTAMGVFGVVMYMMRKKGLCEAVCDE